MARKLGSRTKAVQALQGQNLQGKVAVVTGGNSGIGVETVRAFAVAGAKVYLCCRKPEQGEAVAADIKKDPAAKGEVIVKQLDLADLHNVKQFVDTYSDRLDILVLNAGVLPTQLERTKQGIESQFGVNHIGHFLLTTSLLPRMVAQGTPARIVSVSSELAHVYREGWNLDDWNWEKRQYKTFLAYGQSKMANVMFAKEIARRYKDTAVRAFSLHPGVINTNLMQHTAPWLQWVVSFLLSFFGKTPSQGAATSVYAATAPELESHSGAYLQDCSIAKNSPIADSEAEAARLWKISEDIVAKALAPSS